MQTTETTLFDQILTLIDFAETIDDDVKTTWKNETAPPFRQAEFDILYARGISYEGDILDLGVKYGVLEKSGAYFRRGEETLGQGREAAKNYLQQNPKIAAALEQQIREKSAENP
jgi:recombination protein RecA